MSFYRTFIAAIAAMSLVTAVFAKENATQTPVTATAPKATAAQPVANKVNINKATAQELAAVNGMSMSKAKAIVSYRKKNGEFKSLDELKTVKGFKRMDEKTMKDLVDQLTVG